MIFSTVPRRVCPTIKTRANISTTTHLEEALALEITVVIATEKDDVSFLTLLNLGSFFET